jgi:hypothetical protein
VPDQYSTDPVQSVRIAASEGVGFERQFCVAGRDQSRSSQILLTQLEVSQGASFEILLIRFRRRNHLVRTSQLLRAQHLGKHIQGSTEIIGPDPGKPFRPISEEARVHILRQISVDSDGGIIRVHCQSLGGVQIPRGDHPGFILFNRGQIFRLTGSERLLEVRATQLRQFLGISEELSHQGEYSSLATVVV